MADDAVRVLLIDDDKDACILTRRLVSKCRKPRLNLDWVCSFEDGLEAIQRNHHNVYLVDYRLGDASGLNLVRRAMDLGCAAPMILMTAYWSYDIDREAISLGAADYLVKGQVTPSLLERTISHALGRKQAEVDLRESEELYRGLSEFASSVIHNIGNVLNSIYVSGQEIQSVMEGSKMSGLVKAVDMLKAHEEELGDYLKNDPKGKLLLPYLVSVRESLQKERKTILQEIREIHTQASLMRDIIDTQQSLASSRLRRELLSLPGIVNEALAVHNKRITGSDVAVFKSIATEKPVKAVRVKITHIVINLIKNALESMEEAGDGPHRISFETGEQDDTYVFLRISDTGIGVSEENMKKMFTYGFTTKEDGHGFGLHYCKKVMDDLGGDILVNNNADGQGVCFTLLFPIPKDEWGKPILVAPDIKSPFDEDC